MIFWRRSRSPWIFELDHYPLDRIGRNRYYDPFFGVFIRDYCLDVGLLGDRRRNRTRMMTFIELLVINNKNKSIKVS